MVDGGCRRRRASISSSTRRPWLPAPRRRSGSLPSRARNGGATAAPGRDPEEALPAERRRRRGRRGRWLLTIATSTRPSATRRAASTELVVVISKRSGVARRTAAAAPAATAPRPGSRWRRRAGWSRVRSPARPAGPRAKTPRRRGGSGCPARPRRPGWGARRGPRFSNSATPKRCSMRRSCCDTADAVLFSRRAASPTEPVWATTSASWRAGNQGGIHS